MPYIPSASADSTEEYDPSPTTNVAKALRYFHAKTFREAAVAARAHLRNAENCPRCSHALANLHDRLGSTLFRDDDPRALIAAFDPEERNSCTLQILAACIVLNGRDRVVPTVH
jgi:hypothetical protein